MDAAGGAADVQRLAGVLLEVHPLDADPDGLAVDLDVEPAVDAQRLVVLADLEVLRHVRVEVVLPGEPAPGRDRQLSASPMRMVASMAAWLATGRLPGRPRQTGQTWVFGSAPNSVRAAAEHLGLGAQLDVRLQADHRLEAGDASSKVSSVTVLMLVLQIGRSARTSPSLAVSSRPARGSSSTARGSRCRFAASRNRITWV